MIVLPDFEESELYLQLRNPVLFWNWVGLELNRLTHSIGGPKGGPVLSASALGMLHLAIHDSYFAIDTTSGHATYLVPSGDMARQLPPVVAGSDPKQAIAGAAIAVLSTLYLTPNPKMPQNVTAALTNLLNDWKAKYLLLFPALNPGSDGFKFGDRVGHVILKLLAIGPDDPGVGDVLNTGEKYKPKETRFKFQNDPGHSVRVAFVDPFDHNAGTTINPATSYGPFYGNTAIRFAVQHGHADRASDMHHKIDLPPGDTPPVKAEDLWVHDELEYHSAFKQVKKVGGTPNANDTHRQPDQTVAALFWA